MQVGAMKRDRGKLVIFDRDAIDQSTVLVQPAYLVHHAGLLENLVSQVQSSEDAHRVGPDSDGGADVEQRGRLFENLRLETELPKRECGSQPTNSAANDRDPDHPAESTPKALANASPGLERKRQPWDAHQKPSPTLKGLKPLKS